LCAENDIRSTLSFDRSTGILPVACAESTWKTIPRERQISPIAGMSWITPISLFTYITETRIVSGRSAASNFSSVTSPFGSTSRYVTS
jgi:hypothetical protein